MPVDGSKISAVLTGLAPFAVVLPPATSTLPLGNSAMDAPKLAAMVPDVLDSVGATFTTRVAVAVEFAPLPSVTVSV